MSTPHLTLRPASLDEIYLLRFAVLRPNRIPERVHWLGDDSPPPQTFHFAAFLNTPNTPPQTIACLTLLTSSWQTPETSTPAYQLRGMAVHESFRSQKIGSQLLTLATHHIFRETPIRLLWCNARTPAIPFYLRHNWQIASEEFLIEDAGPHKKMLRFL